MSMPPPPPPPPPSGPPGQPPFGQGGPYGEPAWQPPQPATTSIPDYLVQSILVTLFCCLPLGIAAIVFAAQANSKKGVGDYAGAMAAAQKAKTFCWVSLGLGAVVAVIYLFGLVAATGSGT